MTSDFKITCDLLQPDRTKITLNSKGRISLNFTYEIPRYLSGGNYSGYIYFEEKLGIFTIPVRVTILPFGLYAEPREINSTCVAGNQSTFETIVTLKGGDANNLSIYLAGEIANWSQAKIVPITNFSIQNDSFVLSDGGRFFARITVDVPYNTSIGLHYGEIIITYCDSELRIPVVLNVTARETKETLYRPYTNTEDLIMKTITIIGLLLLSSIIGMLIPAIKRRRDD
jgi:hypothetical protein